MAEAMAMRLNHELELDKKKLTKGVQCSCMQEKPNQPIRAASLA
jgi:hypothetical protein